MEKTLNLDSLSPAEIMVVAMGPALPAASFMEATYLDLISRKVLSLEVRSIKGSKHTFVGLGPQHSKATLRKYELGFIKVFALNTSITHLEYRRYVSLAKKYCQGSVGFLSTLLSSPALRGLIRRTFLDILRGVWRLTPAGESARLQLKATLAEAGRTGGQPANPSALMAAAGVALLATSPPYRKLWAAKIIGSQGGDGTVVDGFHSPKDGHHDHGLGGDAGCWADSSGCSSDGSGCSGGGDSTSSGCSGCGGGGCSGCSS